MTIGEYRLLSPAEQIMADHLSKLMSVLEGLRLEVQSLREEIASERQVH